MNKCTRCGMELDYVAPPEDLCCECKTDRQISDAYERRRERLEIAKAAMQALVVRLGAACQEEIARQSFGLADAMLAEADKETK